MQGTQALENGTAKGFKGPGSQNGHLEEKPSTRNLRAELCTALRVTLSNCQARRAFQEEAMNAWITFTLLKYRKQIANISFYAAMCQ